MKFTSILLLLCLHVVITAQAAQLKTIHSGLKQPVELKFFPSSDKQLLVAGKEGELTFLNLSNEKQYQVHSFAVESGVEMGLLGLAFHPKFNDNRYLFVNYNPKEGELRTRVSRYTLGKNVQGEYRLSDEKIIIEVEQPHKNHNGGQVAFGREGYLYIGMGDGGSGGDPYGHGQNRETLLGNMLRIDINTEDKVPYVIPSDNPFVDQAPIHPEIWAYGLRNPWRFSFNGETLIVADVGQNKYEEVSVVEKGQNLGWNIMEGQHCFKPKKDCDKAGLTLPKITYDHKAGLSITGGYVYQGKLMPELFSHYIYADFILGGVWAAAYPSLSAPTKLFNADGINLSAFALDAKGEIYAADFASGDIYQLVP